MKATTSNRAEASRRNGQKSQGPITAEGKANSARNSFKHGLYSKHAVLDEEDAAALESLREDLRAEHQPINIIEGMLVEELAMNYWSINRYRTLEVNALNNNAAFPTIVAIQRFLTSAQRAFHRVLKELQSLQKGRGFVPQNAKSESEVIAAAPAVEDQSDAGFVPQKVATAQTTAPGSKTITSWSQLKELDLLNCTEDDIDQIAGQLVKLSRVA